MLDRERFLEKYHLEKAFEKSNLDWNILDEIYENYSGKMYPWLQECASQGITDLNQRKKDIQKQRPDWGKDIHVIYGRVKEPEHVIEKIIRKVGDEDSQKYRDINIDTYRNIIKDLIGIRVIVITKEGWKEAHELICALFSEFYEDTPKAYVCYGDRKIFEEESIDVDYTVKGYRSQHYVVQYKKNYAEIQVRTIAEEVYGEFDHRVRYPYFKDNKFLIRYTNMISKGIAELDDMISTCMQLDEELLASLSHKFKEDKYVDWAKEQINSKDSIAAEQIETIRSGNAEEILKSKLF